VIRPVCPRCGSTEYIRRGAPGCSPLLWSCRSCRFHYEHLDLAVQIWRLWHEVDRITREAAS
jgi:transposase-like protein